MPQSPAVPGLDPLSTEVGDIRELQHIVSTDHGSLWAFGRNSREMSIVGDQFVIIGGEALIPDLVQEELGAPEYRIWVAEFS